MHTFTDSYAYIEIEIRILEWKIKLKIKFLKLIIIFYECSIDNKNYYHIVVNSFLSTWIL